MPTPHEQLRGGFVWIAAGIFLLTYGILGLFQADIPGIANLVSFIESAEGGWLFLAAFLSIFLEGLYLIGSFFPGTTLVLIIAILGQVAGPIYFLGIILAIYVGWITAGSVNMLATKAGYIQLSGNTTIKTAPSDDTGLTWFPAFRANTEVAQIIAGHSTRAVFLSSLRVKTIACVGLIFYALTLPRIIDITTVSNEEGFRSIAIFALINFAIGGYKLRAYIKGRRN